MDRGAQVSYHDPHVPTFPRMRKHTIPLSSVKLDAATLKSADCVLVVTDHDAVDYQAVASNAPLVVDTRNAMRKTSGGTVVQA
jgi:UDP-N-acetyl-D-glucosamine dehydrogenase